MIGVRRGSGLLALGLLALALAMNLLELVMRKWKGLLEALHLTPVEAT